MNKLINVFVYIIAILTMGYTIHEADLLHFCIIFMLFLGYRLLNKSKR